MKFLAGFILSVSLSISASTAAFANGPYVAVGADIGSFEHQPQGGLFGDAASYTDVALNARIGYDFLTYFGVEAEGAIHLGGSATFSEETDNDFDGVIDGMREFEDDVTSRFGLFLRGRFPVTDTVTGFARGGLGVRNERNNFRSVGIAAFDGEPFESISNRSSSDIYAAIGIGAEFSFTEDGRNAIRGEFTRYSAYIGGEDQEVDVSNDNVVSVAYVRRF